MISLNLILAHGQTYFCAVPNTFPLYPELCVINIYLTAAQLYKRGFSGCKYFPCAKHFFFLLFLQKRALYLLGWQIRLRLESHYIFTHFTRLHKLDEVLVLGCSGDFLNKSIIWRISIIPETAGTCAALLASRNTRMSDLLRKRNAYKEYMSQCFWAAIWLTKTPSLWETYIMITHK